MMLINLYILSISNIHLHHFLLMNSGAFSYKILNAKVLVLSFCSNIGIISQILMSSIFFFFLSDCFFEHQNVPETLTLRRQIFVSQVAVCIWK